MWVYKGNYAIKFLETGAVEFFSDDINSNNIVKNKSWKFALPFVKGTQTKDYLLKLKEIPNNKDMDKSFSCSECTVNYKFFEEYLTMEIQFNDKAYLRTGIDFDIRFLDSDNDGLEDKMMMTECYLDNGMEYGYFMFRRKSGQYFVLIVHEKFAAYRLKYSYFGHRINGFQILARTEDLKCAEHLKLGETEKLRCSMFFSKNENEAKVKIADMLGICIPKFKLSGDYVGNKFKFSYVGNLKKIKIISPNGRIEIPKCEELEYSFVMREEGMYKLKFEDKVVSEFQVLAHANIREYFRRICRFNKNHFQHETGAFYRAINKNSLKPDNSRTFEGVHFGNPNEKMSCRTGEFGGFAGWSILKYLEYTKENEYLESVKKYLEEWALNLHNDKPLFGTVTRESQIYGGKKYTPYHLFKEVNFPQYEIFLMEQLVDYYRIVKDRKILKELFQIANHFVNDHIDNGKVVYRNEDYSSVHTPAILFIKISKLAMEEDEMKKSEIYGKVAEKICKHIESRGLNFPTEGEKCTEDGSIACSALQLLYYCWHVEYNHKYFLRAEELLEVHKMLEFTLPDAKAYGSSIRFWETLYETRDYGPSFNCGHAWSIWISEAKFYMGLITNKSKWIEESYCGFISNMSKVESNGGMSTCYTPDIIPGTPHHYFLFRYDIKGVLFREKKAMYGRGYSKKSYSSSGNYFLIKYAETFDWLSSIDMENDTTVNLRMNKGIYEGLGRKFDSLMIDNVINGIIKIKTCSEITIYTKRSEKISSDFNEMKIISNNRIIAKPKDGIISIKCLK